MKIKNRLLSALLVCVSVFFALPAHSQQAIAWSSLDSNAIMIGDHVTYNIGVTLPRNAWVQWPIFVDSISGNIEIIGQTKIDTVFNENDLKLSQELVITSFDSGYFELPQVNFKFGYENDTSVFVTSSGNLFLQVFVPKVDTTKAFMPIVSPLKEPYTFAEILPWILVVTAVILVVVLAIFYFVRRKKNKPLFVKKPVPLKPPHIIAIRRLEELRLAKIWQSGHLKKYHSEITDILREYIGRRYNIDAVEMTSYEIIEELNNLKVNKEVLSKVESIMNLADLVKFAKSVPTALENDLSIVHSTDFVNETKVIEQPKSDEDNESDNSITKSGDNV